VVRLKVLLVFLGGGRLRRAGVSHWEGRFGMVDAEIARRNILIARDSAVWPLAQRFSAVMDLVNAGTVTVTQVGRGSMR